MSDVEYLDGVDVAVIDGRLKIIPEESEYMLDLDDVERIKRRIDTDLEAALFE